MGTCTNVNNILAVSQAKSKEHNSYGSIHSPSVALFGLLPTPYCVEVGLFMGLTVLHRPFYASFGRVCVRPF